MTWHRSIPVDAPTQMGRVYPRALIKRMITRTLASGSIFAVLEADGLSVPLHDVVGCVTSAKVEEGHLWIHIKPWHTGRGEIFMSLVKAGVEFNYTPVGSGTVGVDGVVQDYALSCFSVDPRRS